MKTLDAIVGRHETFIQLGSPTPGWYRPTVGMGDPIHKGCVIGELEALGRRYAVVAPDVTGIVPVAPEPRRAVAYGDRLVLVSKDAPELGLHGASRGRETAVQGAAGTTQGLVFRAPTSGRFYGRPSPDRPAFVEVGAELVAGTTICLLEVMKTFHRVTYGGADVPARAKVRELLVADGADVSAGEALLALEALT